MGRGVEAGLGSDGGRGIAFGTGSTIASRLNPLPSIGTRLSTRTRGSRYPAAPNTIKSAPIDWKAHLQFLDRVCFKTFLQAAISFLRGAQH
jgi:hypothetical protein